MAYRIEFKPSAYKDLLAIEKKYQASIIKKIETLADDPLPPGVKKLKGIKDLYRIRQGVFRIIYQLKKKEVLILIVAIGHRKGIYN